MAKKKKPMKNRDRYSEGGTSHGTGVDYGGRISRNPGMDKPTGVSKASLRAQGKVEELVARGYRLNANGPTSSVYKAAVREADSPAGRIKHLLTRRPGDPWRPNSGKKKKKP